VNLSTWLIWIFALASVVMAVDKILARWFGIGESQDSLFIVWCAMGCLLLIYRQIYSVKSGSGESVVQEPGSGTPDS
jgi:ethanolamine transporter EutH